MAMFKLIEKETNIKSLKMTKYQWDVVVNGVPYQVVKIHGYVHSMGGQWGENDLWMYPRDQDPTYENLVEYYCDGNGVCWGILYDPHNYVRRKHTEPECFTSGGAYITRNGEKFYHCSSGIDEARYRIKQISEHPLNLFEYQFDKKMIGRKVWWRSQPAIITKWIGNGDACVILEPDPKFIAEFDTPKEFLEEYDYEDPEDKEFIKTSIFDEHIWWFREE